MEVYFKRFFIGHLLILVIVAFAILFLGGTRLIAILLFVGLIESLFYYLDTKYFPKRRTEITNELIETFKAESISEGVLKFKMDTIDFFVKVEIDFKQSLQLANIDTVKFHIPITQIDELSVKPGQELTENKIDGVQTYEIHQINSSELKFAKEGLKNMIK
ncbi:MAG: hypothetical protein RIG62_07050 [Cyclobacteriaceae bacterium]